MDDRWIDLSDNPARLNVDLGRLRIASGETSTTIPLSDIAALVISHPAVNLTQAVLGGIAEAGGLVIVCNSKHLPVGMLLPLNAHFTQTERMTAQVESSVPLRKQLWKQIVKAKVLAQGNLLKSLNGSDAGLSVLSRKVRSGDAVNLEAQAARKYWPALFGADFRRDQMAEDHNRLMNYGYAVIRAMMTRAICAVGLHPSLGLHHHNRYNPFCLADDLMEPFRPIVDSVVLQLIRKHGADVEINKELKAEFLPPLISARYLVEDSERTLFDIFARLATNLAGVYMKTSARLSVPVITYETRTP